MAGRTPRRNERPDHDGTHRLAFARNKKKIYATQTVCGICGKPVDFSYKYPHPLSPCIDNIIHLVKSGNPRDQAIHERHAAGPQRKGAGAGCGVAARSAPVP